VLVVARGTPQPDPSRLDLPRSTQFDYTAWDLSNPLVSSSGRPGSSSAEPEPDDWLHDPTLTAHSRGSIFTLRGLLNLGTLFILGLLLFMLFAGYPIVQELRSRRPSTLGAFKYVLVAPSLALISSLCSRRGQPILEERILAACLSPNTDSHPAPPAFDSLGGTNGSGQVPELIGNFGLSPSSPYLRALETPCPPLPGR